jgi:signal transduction histidine kinase
MDNKLGTYLSVLLIIALTYGSVVVVSLAAGRSAMRLTEDKDRLARETVELVSLAMSYGSDHSPLPRATAQLADLVDRLRSDVSSQSFHMLGRLHSPVREASRDVAIAARALGTSVDPSGPSTDSPSQVPTRVLVLKDALVRLVDALDEFAPRQVRVLQAFYQVLLAAAVLFVVFAFGVRREAVRRRASEQRARRLSQQLLTVRDEEHKRLAMDLHDAVAQEIYAASVHLQNGDVERALEQLDRAARSVRDLSRTLHTFDADLDCVDESLRRVADIVFLDTVVQCTISVAAGIDDALRPAVLEQLLLIAREAFLNVRKHADAGRVAVTVVRSAPFVVLKIVDDGRGFDPPCNRESEGLGVPVMRERAAQLGGTLSVTSEAGEGTTVLARLPMERSTHHGETTASIRGG